MAKTVYPEGIESDASSQTRSFGPGWRFAVLASLLALGLLGYLGGGPPTLTGVDSPGARFEVSAHERLRNGNMYEVRFRVVARQPMRDAVIALPTELLRDATVNSLTPEPQEEAVVGEEYRFHLGPLAEGQATDFKIDGQLNPTLYGPVAGVYRLLDGDREIARSAARLWVIP